MANWEAHCLCASHKEFGVSPLMAAGFMLPIIMAAGFMPAKGKPFPPMPGIPGIPGMPGIPMPGNMPGNMPGIIPGMPPLPGLELRERLSLHLPPGDGLE